MSNEARFREALASAFHDPEEGTWAGHGTIAEDCYVCSRTATAVLAALPQGDTALVKALRTGDEDLVKDLAASLIFGTNVVEKVCRKVKQLGALLSDAHPGDDEGEEVSRDRRELWLLDNYLAVNGTNPGQRERRRLLHQYLCETCTHEWADVSGWGGSPEGTHQCSWCNEVLTPEEWRDPHADRAAGETGEVER